MFAFARPRPCNKKGLCGKHLSSWRFDGCEPGLILGGVGLLSGHGVEVRHTCTCTSHLNLLPRAPPNWAKSRILCMPGGMHGCNSVQQDLTTACKSHAAGVLLVASCLLWCALTVGTVFACIQNLFLQEVKGVLRSANTYTTSLCGTVCGITCSSAHSVA